jgi:hypothetical protein
MATEIPEVNSTKRGEGVDHGSVFLCQCHGLLRLPLDLIESNPQIASDSIVIMQLGANKDRYFTQIMIWKSTLRRSRFLSCYTPTPLLCWPSIIHQIIMLWPKNAFLASHLNLKDGGKNTLLFRDGWFIDANGTRITHPMLSSKNKQKGIQTILEERILFVRGMRLQDTRTMFSRQSDFKSQIPLLREMVESLGHRIVLSEIPSRI